MARSKRTGLTHPHSHRNPALQNNSKSNGADKKPYDRPEKKETRPSAVEPKQEAPNTGKTQHRVFMIAGSPNSGKTRFLNQLALQQDQDKVQKAFLKNTRSPCTLLPLCAIGGADGTSGFFALVEHGTNFTVEAVLPTMEEWLSFCESNQPNQFTPDEMKDRLDVKERYAQFQLVRKQSDNWFDLFHLMNESKGSYLSSFYRLPTLEEVRGEALSKLKRIFATLQKETPGHPRITLFSGKKENFIEDMIDLSEKMAALNSVASEMPILSAVIRVNIKAPFRFLEENNISLLDVPSSFYLNTYKMRAPVPVDSLIGFSSGRCVNQHDFLIYKSLLTTSPQSVPCHLVYNSRSAFYDSSEFSAEEQFEIFQKNSVKNIPQGLVFKKVGFILFISDVHRKRCDEQLLAMADKSIEEALSL